MLARVLMVALAGLVMVACDLTTNYMTCSSPSSTGTWPYDMQWCDTDPDNGWPVNPGYYGGYNQDPAKTSITNRVSQNYAHNVTFNTGLCGLTNGFMVYDKTVMFTGSLFWASHASDDDYNMDLLTPMLAGTSLQVETWHGSLPLLHLEFDSDETIDHYDGNPWWKQFHNAVDSSGAAAAALVDWSNAIVIGRWVMDCAHDCRAEVHPVLGLAVQTKPRPTGAGVEEWQFFLRARGNQGYCGDDNVGGIWSDTTFRFEGRPGSATATASDVWVHKSRVTYDLAWDGDDLLLTGHLPYTSDWIVGTVQITYHAGGTS